MTTQGPGPLNELPIFAPRAPGVLVVEDDETIRTMLCRGLRLHGFALWESGNGRDAVETYRTHLDTIDLVLLDVQMPGLDGPRTLRALQGVNAHVRCCFMSGNTGHYTERELIELGGSHFFQKPFALAEVAQVLWRLVGASQPKVA